MSVPTITSVTPSTVFAGGQLITIVGTNFRLPYPPPGAFVGPLPVPPPTMAITIGGQAATRVVVRSATEVTCFTPKGKPGKTSAPNPPVAVQVQNLDVTGAPIGGEVATMAAAISFVRVDLSIDDDFTRLVRALLNLLKDQVIENVTKQTSVDYGDNAGSPSFDITNVGALPALVVAGPTVKEDNFYDLERRPEVSVMGGYQTRLSWLTTDLVFKIYGFDNNEARALNLFALTNKVLSFETFLTMDRDPADLSKGTVSYEMAWQGFQFQDLANTSDVRSFSGELIVRGYQFEDATGFPNRVVESGGTAEDIEIQTGQKV